MSHGAEMEHGNRQDRTALFLAAISGHPKALAVLIQKGAKVCPSSRCAQTALGSNLGSKGAAFHASF